MRGLGPLTVRGIGALALIVACFVLADQLGLVELLAFGILLTALVAGSALLLVITRLRADVERTAHPEAPAAGDEMRVSVRVRIRSAFPRARARWEDALPDQVEADAAGVFPAVASSLRRATDEVRLDYDATAWRRGIHFLGPLRVTSTDPFGLVRRRQQIGQATRILVAPPVVDLVGIPPTDGDRGGTVHATTTRRGQGVDNLIARPYAPGDSMRRIHWRATAHRDELMVREEERESSPHATLVLDRAASRYGDGAGEAPGLDDAFENAVVAYLSIARRFVLAGFAVTLLDTDGALIHEGIDGGDVATFDELVERFANVTARGGADAVDAVHLLAGEGPLVIVTGALEGADGAALAPLARERDLAVLCASAPRADALDAAATAGWRTLSATADTDLRAVWSAMCQQGATRVAG